MKKLIANRFAGPIAVIIIILFSNIIYLSHFTNSNPINTQSGLAISSRMLVNGEDTIDPNDGTTTQALGHVAAEDILHGHMPWWNYNEQVGAPLASDMQSASLFPFTLILALSNGLLYFHIILELIVGVSTYYLLLRLGLRRLTGVVFGTTFGLNAAFAWFGSPNFNPIAFLPVLVLGIETAYDKTLKNQKKGWFLIAAALTLSLYAGFPEGAYLDGLLTTLWAAVRLISLRNGHWCAFLYKLLAGFFVGILLAAPILIAFLGYISNAYIGNHSALAGNVDLPYLSIPMGVFPYIYGPIYGLAHYDSTGVLPIIWGNVGGYVTLSMLFFSGMALFNKNKRALKLTLFAFAAVLAARIYGFPELYHVLNLIPGMSKVAVYRYSQPALVFAVIVLAATGFDEVMRRKRVNRKQVGLVFSVLILMSVVLLPIALKQERLLSLAPKHLFYFVGSLVWSLCSVIVISLSLIFRFKYRRLVCALIVLADVMLMFILPELSAPRSIQIDTSPVGYLKTHLGSYRMYSIGPIQPNYGSYYSIASIDTNDLPLPKNWTNYMIKSLDPATNPAYFAGANLPIPNSLSPKDDLIKYINNYEYVGVKYLLAPPDTLTAGDVKTASLKAVFNSTSATIYELPNPKPYFEVVGGDCRIDSASGKAQVTVDCHGPGKILRRELYSKGWSVKTSGAALSVKQTGPLFQSVKLPSGKHTLKFNYSPPHIYIGLALFIAACLISYICYFRDGHLKRLEKLVKNNY